MDVSEVLKDFYNVCNKECKIVFTPLEIHDCYDNIQGFKILKGTSEHFSQLKFYICDSDEVYSWVSGSRNSGILTNYEGKKTNYYEIKGIVDNINIKDNLESWFLFFINFKHIELNFNVDGKKHKFVTNELPYKHLKELDVRITQNTNLEIADD